MNILIGITGGIGAGKSAVTHDLRGRGETVICADETARLVVEPNKPGSAALRQAFGDAFFLPDGVLDRRKLASHVFGHPERVDRLNGLLHPLIITSMFEKAKMVSGRVFLDAALLIQSGMHTRLDYVWLVVADMETRIRRVMARDSVSREDVLGRINSQMSDDAMKRYASEVIINNGTIDELHQVIGGLLKKPEYSR